MKQGKKRLLESKGYKVSSTEEFLGLTDEESAYIETKVLLAKSFKELRQSKRVSQTEMSKMIGSSQSRVAKMEAGDPSVSTDLLFKGMFALGATRKDISRALTARKAA
ncbi:MAG: helix-turn-helix domain-containing protein [Pseudomonadales bacterium]|nr:helix-turn-helix domain-containing protein [Pseudomonadales bacterium]